MGLFSQAQNSRIRREFGRDTGELHPPGLVTDGALVTTSATGGEVWAFFEITPASDQLAAEEAIEQAVRETAGELGAALRPWQSYHIKVVSAPYRVADYRAGMQQVPGPHAPGWDNYVEMGAERIADGTRDPNTTGHAGGTEDDDAGGGLDGADGDPGAVFARRVVLLGVQVAGFGAGEESLSGQFKASPVLRGLFDKPVSSSQPAPIAEARAGHDRLAQARPAIRKLARTLAGGTRLVAAPAPAGLIAWSWAREFQHGVDFPVWDGPLGAARLAGLVTGEMVPCPDRRTVATHDPATGTTTYLAVLVPTTDGFPATELYAPGDEWIALAATLPGVEVSLRGRHFGQQGSLGLIGDAQNTVRSQQRQSGDAGTATDPELDEAAGALEERRLQVAHREAFLGENHFRLIVAAPSRELLDARVDRAIEAYTGTVTLHRPGNVQDLLWAESLPGDRVRVPEFKQIQPVLTLAGSGFTSGTALGDEHGPYFAWSLGPATEPVRLHLIRRDAEFAREAIATCLLGKTGQGKSTTGMMLDLQALAEGAWVMLVDVKGDLAGIIPAAKDLLDVAIQYLPVDSEAAAGMFDPFRTAGDPQQTWERAITALQMALSPKELDQYGTCLEEAVRKVAGHPPPSTGACPPYSPP